MNFISLISKTVLVALLMIINCINGSPIFMVPVNDSNDNNELKTHRLVSENYNNAKDCDGNILSDSYKCTF